MTRRRRTVAVVITTYNNPKTLELCLLSFQNQTYENFEIFIADDGSGDPTRDLILRLKKQLPFEITHLWHPDVGYRKSKINNTVFRQLDSVRLPVLLCIDHDVIVHRRFIEDHYLAHEAENFEPLLFMGRRVDLSAEVSAKISPENVTRFNHGLNFSLIFSALKNETRNILRSVRIAGPAWLLHVLKRDKVLDLLGSNFSISTQTMIDVNGYNEEFKSYWGEDGDLFVRIRNRKVKYYGLIGYAVQWHLFHTRLVETPEYVGEYQKLLRDFAYIECKNGIRKN